MRKPFLLGLACATALALPVSASAKGPESASITGPGIDGTLELSGRSEGGSPRFATFVTQSGFFPAVFGQTPDPMQATTPPGELGPRYTVTYSVPGPDGKASEIRQDLYPYARPLPVTFVEPGHPFWQGDPDGQDWRAPGGWFVSTPALKQTLVAAGLPASPSAAEWGTRWTRLLVLFLAALGSVLAGLIVWRSAGARRGATAPGAG